MRYLEQNPNRKPTTGMLNRGDLDWINWTASACIRIPGVPDFYDVIFGGVGYFSGWWYGNHSSGILRGGYPILVGMDPVPVVRGSTGLERAFELPAIIEDNGLRELYITLIERMQAESAHLPMTTVQHLLIERIAYNYVVMRWYEMEDRFQHSKAQREFNHFWLEMTKEFNRQMRRGDDETRLVLVQRVFGVIATALDQEEPAVAERLRSNFSEALSAHGL